MLSDMVVAFTALLWYVWLWRAYCIYAFRTVCLAKVQNDFILDKNQGLTCFHAAFSVDEPQFRQKQRSVRKYSCYILREILCSAVLRLNKLGGYSSLFNITLFLSFASFASISSISFSYLLTFIYSIIQTDGNVRDPLEDELRDSVDGSFTKVKYSSGLLLIFCLLKFFSIIFLHSRFLD